MWSENPVFFKDLECIAGSEYIPWDTLREKTVLVTGATGLIGYTLVSGLLYANRRMNLDLRVLALVRDESRAKNRFKMQLEGANDLRLVHGTVEDLPRIDEPVDYIVHGAGQTASSAIVRQPAETIRTALIGTMNLLELSRIKQSKGFAYLSSMEVYGHPAKGRKVTEDEIGALSPLDIRNSYPVSKQQCESLCCAYASEYGVPAVIIRLTQTFGLGVNRGDARIFAEFGRCAAEKRDIVLKTKGETERSYLYTADAATAILTVLLKGEPGTAYNAADETTYCSIAEMARLVAGLAGVRVRFEPQDERKNGFPSPQYVNLDTARLRALGWKTSIDEERTGGKPQSPLWKCFGKNVSEDAS